MDKGQPVSEKWDRKIRDQIDQRLADKTGKWGPNKNEGRNLEG